MSVYKVPQDVEAEDKLVGPFTLKQFIFLVIAIISYYLTYALSQVNIALIIIPLPFALIFTILGVYRRPDQPVELYLASVARFYLKPRLRIWNQDGLVENVIITAPSQIEHNYTDGRDQTQVKSQLKSLAGVMDTRGWSLKNSSIQLPYQNIDSSDRLVNVAELPSVIQPTEVHPNEDMLDTSSNVVAQNFGQMTQSSASQIKDDAISHMQQVAVKNDGTPVFTDPDDPAPSQQAIPAQDIHSAASPAFQPYAQSQAQDDKPTEVPESTSSMTEAASPDIIRLSQNSDLNVSTIARQAEETLKEDDEISLR